MAPSRPIQTTFACSLHEEYNLLDSRHRRRFILENLSCNSLYYYWCMLNWCHEMDQDRSFFHFILLYGDKHFKTIWPLRAESFMETVT
jgi:hypothetical protein